MYCTVKHLRLIAEHGGEMIARSVLDEISEYLLAKETITGEELMAYVKADKEKQTEVPAEETTEE